MERCNCEHIRHESRAAAWTPDEFADIPRDGHPYRAVPAGPRRAMFVGRVCEDCAVDCVGEYIITE